MNVKRILAVWVVVLLAIPSFAQILEPAKWSWLPSKNSAKVGDEIDVIFKVAVDDNWYIYANDFDPECGPMLTEVKFTPHASFKPIGTLKAINPKTKHDEVFGCDVKIFEHNAEFRQKIKILSANLSLSGSYNGQTCTEAGKCIPFDGDFTIVGLTVSGTDGKKNPEPVQQTPEVQKPKANEGELENFSKQDSSATQFQNRKK